MTSILLAIVVVAASPGDIRLTVQPMAAPKPALKYQFLPEVRELNPGNTVQEYVRCFMEQRNFFFNKESVADRNRNRVAPLADLKGKGLHQYGGNVMKRADYAARVNTTDWDVLERIQADGMNHRAPELATLQILAQALQVRFRGQLVERQFDDAVTSIKTMFALARHLSEYPAEDGYRAGVAVAQMALDTMHEMVQQPGCPNLYWALTDLPNPLVDWHKGVQGQGVMVAAEFRQVKNDTAMTTAELEKAVSRFSGLLGLAREQAGRSPRNIRSVFEGRAKDAERVRAVRIRTIMGDGEKLKVPSFPPLQVILLDEIREYDAMRDERVKLLSLAPWQADALAKTAAADGVFADFLPNATDILRTQGQIEQRIAALRCVEALRLFAAEHGGKLPEKLAGTALPLPMDPFTGKPFEYRVEGSAGILQGGGLRYEVTMKGQPK